MEKKSTFDEKISFHVEIEEKEKRMGIEVCGGGRENIMDGVFFLC